MKRKYALITVFCLLLNLFVLTSNANPLESKGISTPTLDVSPYKTIITPSGERRIVASNGLVMNQIIANVDQVVDVESYIAGENDDFFGVEIVAIKQLFYDEWIDAIIEKIGYKFGYLITIPDDLDIEDAIKTLEDNEHITSVSQNAMSLEPQDIQYDDITAETGHYNLIGVDYAWNHGFVGSHDVQVGLIDVGMKAHSEFDNNVRFDMGFNACYEFDYGENDADDVKPIRTDGYKSHGHKMAGIIGADYGDEGVNGICQNVSIVPILAEGYPEIWEWALYYAVVSDVDVIHISWDLATNTIYDIIEDADILVVMPAGNGSSELVATSENIYANLPNCIVVGNSTVYDEKYFESNYSATYVDLFAPGYGVKTVGYDDEDGYVIGRGTCSAAAMVSAAAALIMSHATHLSAIEVKELILDNVDVVSALEDYCSTGGRLAIDKAVEALYTENRGSYSKGDLNGDGYINTTDCSMAQWLASNIMTPSATQLNAADINGDGAVTSSDVAQIREFYYKNSYFPPV